MIGEFKTAKVWRIFAYIVSPLLIAASMAGIFIPFSMEEFSWAVCLILVPISLGGALIFAYAFVETIKSRLIIRNGYISQASVFGTRTLAFGEIKGYRVDNHCIHIVANNPGKKSLKMTSYMERSREVVSWLNDHFPELDSNEAIEEEKQILSDNQFGINQQLREYRLNEARRLAKYLNIAGIAVGIWLWLYPRPYAISFLTAVIVPFIALGAIYLYSGLITFNEKKNSAYPTILYAFMGPCLSLTVRTFNDYELLEYVDLWLVIGPFAVVLSGLIIIGTKELKKLVDYLTLLPLIAMTLGYAYGACVITNCFFDKSKPEIFHSKVIDKEISSGEATTYYLILNPWGPRTKPDRLHVTQYEYETTEIDSIVDIYLKQGNLKLPWLYIGPE